MTEQILCWNQSQLLKAQPVEPQRTVPGSALTHCPMHYVYTYMKEAFCSVQEARIEPFSVHLLTHRD